MEDAVSKVAKLCLRNLVIRVIELLSPWLHNKEVSNLILLGKFPVGSPSDSLNRDNLRSLIPGGFQLLSCLEIDKVLVGLLGTHVHDWIHVEAEIGVDEDHHSLESVLANGGDLALVGSTFELHLIPEEESHGELALD